MVFLLFGCGIFQKSNSKNEDVSKVEQDSQQVQETETELGTEVELGTELGTEIEEDTEVEMEEAVESNSETKHSESTEVKKQESVVTTPVQENEPESEQPKVETPTTETVVTKPEVPNQEASKVEEPESESEIQTPEPEIARGQYLVKGQSLIGASLSVGDGMYDITVTTVNGETLVLSEILKEKDMVLLNFWATWCRPCVSEFPHMAEAYNLYKDDVEVIALSVEGADASTIEAFRRSNNLPFKVGQCTSSWLYAFNKDMTIPTSVFIDRYGIIREIKIGSIPDVQGFTSRFESYID